MSYISDILNDVLPFRKSKGYSPDELDYLELKRKEAEYLEGRLSEQNLPTKRFSWKTMPSKGLNTLLGMFTKIPRYVSVAVDVGKEGIASEYSGIEDIVRNPKNIGPFIKDSLKLWKDLELNTGPYSMYSYDVPLRKYTSWGDKPINWLKSPTDRILDATIGKTVPELLTGRDLDYDTFTSTKMNEKVREELQKYYEGESEVTPDWLNKMMSSKTVSRISNLPLKGYGMGQNVLYELTKDPAALLSFALEIPSDVTTWIGAPGALATIKGSSAAAIKGAAAKGITKRAIIQLGEGIAEEAVEQVAKRGLRLIGEKAVSVDTLQAILRRLDDLPVEAFLADDLITKTTENIMRPFGRNLTEKGVYGATDDAMRLIGMEKANLERAIKDPLKWRLTKEGIFEPVYDDIADIPGKMRLTKDNILKSADQIQYEDDLARYIRNEFDKSPKGQLSFDIDPTDLGNPRYQAAMQRAKMDLIPDFKKEWIAKRVEPTAISKMFESGTPTKYLSQGGLDLFIPGTNKRWNLIPYSMWEDIGLPRFGAKLAAKTPAKIKNMTNMLKKLWLPERLAPRELHEMWMEITQLHPEWKLKKFDAMQKAEREARGIATDELDLAVEKLMIVGVVNEKDIDKLIIAAQKSPELYKRLEDLTRSYSKELNNYYKMQSRLHGLGKEMAESEVSIMGPKFKPVIEQYTDELGKTKQRVKFVELQQPTGKGVSQSDIAAKNDAFLKGLEKRYTTRYNRIQEGIEKAQTGTKRLSELKNYEWPGHLQTKYTKEGADAAEIAQVKLYNSKIRKYRDLIQKYMDLPQEQKDYVKWLRDVNEQMYYYENIKGIDYNKFETLSGSYVLGGESKNVGGAGRLRPASDQIITPAVGETPSFVKGKQFDSVIEQIIENPGKASSAETSLTMLTRKRYEKSLTAVANTDFMKKAKRFGVSDDLLKEANWKYKQNRYKLIGEYGTDSNGIRRAETEAIQRVIDDMGFDPRKFTEKLTDKDNFAEHILKITEDTNFTPEVADYLKASTEFFTDKNVKKFMQIMRSFNKWWKSFATVVIPGFHSRNAQSNLYNMFLGNGPSVFNPRLHSTVIDAMIGVDDSFYHPILKRNVSYTEFLDTAGERGMMNLGLVGEEITSADLRAIQKASPKTFAEKAVTIYNPGSVQGPLVKAGSLVGLAVENEARLAMFLDNWLKYGDADFAAQRVNQFLFNYRDISVFDNTIMKQIIPFWVWSKKNVPLQFKNLARQPWKFGTFVHLRDFMRNISEDPTTGEIEDYEFEPTYISELMGVPLPFKTPSGTRMVYNPNFAFQDIGKVEWRDWLSGLSPLLKIPIESIANQELFTGAPIRTGLKEAPAYLDWMRKTKVPMPGVYAGKNYEGEDITMMDPTLLYMINQIPLAGNIGRAMPQSERLKEKSPLKLLSMLAGVKFFEYNPETAEYWELKDRIAELEKLKDFYRKQGLWKEEY